MLFRKLKDRILTKVYIERVFRREIYKLRNILDSMGVEVSPKGKVTCYIGMVYDNNDYNRLCLDNKTSDMVSKIRRLQSIKEALLDFETDYKLYAHAVANGYNQSYLKWMKNIVESTILELTESDIQCPY